MYYIEIHIKGRIDANLSDWFGELKLQENTRDETILHGKLPDVSAAYGVISRLGSLVIPLASICVEESDIHQRRIAEEEPVHPVN
jgi:hypothetical protein